MTTQQRSFVRWFRALSGAAAASLFLLHSVNAFAFGANECAASRFGGDLNCTAGDVSITGISVVSGSTSSCIGGTSVTLDLDLTVNSATPSRYDIGIFIANDGNDALLHPSNGGAASCSVSVLPPTDPPFQDLDPGPHAGVTDTCGDVSGSMNGGTGTGILRMTNVTVNCKALSGSSGKLFIPFVVSWDQQASPTGAICRSNADPVPGTKSKCNAPLVGQGTVNVVVMPTISKSDGITSIGAGGSTIYTVVITNTTGDTLSGAVFKDPAVANLTVNSLSCAAAGGATCPATSIAAMQGGGITIPSMPVNSSVTFSIGATVATGAAGSITNTASVTTQSQTNSASDTNTVVAVDHYELSQPSSGVACLPSTVTVTACADSSSPCTNPSTSVNGQTATLATSAGSLGATSVTFNASGVASTTLSYPAAANGAPAMVTLSNEQTPAVNARKCCPDGASCVIANSCSTTFNTAGFIFSSAADGGVATIPSQVAGTSSGTHYLRAVRTGTTTKACEAALTGSNSVSFGYECNNPTTCSGSNLMSIDGGTATTIQRNNNGAAISYVSVPMTFDANGNAPFTLNYRDVGQVTLRAGKTVNSAVLTGASNAFVVKPYGFRLSNIVRTSDSFANPGASSPADARFIGAGQNFSVTATAVLSDGVTPTPNYGRETTPEGVALSPTLVAPAGGTNPAVASTTGFGGFSGGAATGTDFRWGEVGIIRFTPGVADGSYLGAGNATNVTSGNIGRFTPDHFDVTVAHGCNAGGFTYSGQAFASVTVTPYSATNGTINNYLSGATGFAKNTTISNAGDATNFSSNIFSGGAGGHFTGTNGSSNTVTYTFAIKETAPITLALRAVDTDNVSSAGHMEPSALVRSGRVAFGNAFGSELLDLRVPLSVQYYGGATTGFVANAADTCTGLALVFSNFQGNLNVGETCVQDAGSPGLSGQGCATAGPGTEQFKEPAVGGDFNLYLRAPGMGNSGSVDISADLSVSPWLRFDWDGDGVDDNDPVGLARFGVFRGSSRHIYLRERY